MVLGYRDDKLKMGIYFIFLHPNEIIAIVYGVLINYFTSCCWLYLLLLLIRDLYVRQCLWKRIIENFVFKAHSCAGGVN